MDSYQGPGLQTDSDPYVISVIVTFHAVPWVVCEC